MGNPAARVAPAAVGFHRPISADRLPPKPRSRVVREEPQMDGVRCDAGRVAGCLRVGVLLVPKDLPPGERRPVVVCQHGLEGGREDIGDPRRRLRRVQGVRRAAWRSAASSCSRRRIRIAARTASARCSARPTRSGNRCSRIIVPQHEGSSPGSPRCRSSIPSGSLSTASAMAARRRCACRRWSNGMPVDLLGRLQRVGVEERVHSTIAYSYCSTGEYEIFEWNLGQHVQLRGDGGADRAAAVHGGARARRRRGARRMGRPTSTPRCCAALRSSKIGDDEIECSTVRTRSTASARSTFSTSTSAGQRRRSRRSRSGGSEPTCAVSSCF